VRAGLPYPRQIVAAIEACSGMALIVTPGANDSQDVLQELQIAHTERKLIAPVVVGGVAPSKDLRYYIGVRHQVAWTSAAAASEAVLKGLGVAPSAKAAGPAPGAALGPIGPYDVQLLHPAVAGAVLAARAAEQQAHAKAVEARQMALRAEQAEKRAKAGASGTVKGGDATQTWAGEGANGMQNGAGVLRSLSGEFAGDVYCGNWSSDKRSSLGVESYGDNANNSVGSLRHEGEYADGKRNGLGVYLWRNGNSHAGGFRDNLRDGPGVLRFADGLRYEGEFGSGKFNGLGVYWNADGTVHSAGRWQDAKLVEAMKP
jgi:hypothetical protein